MEPEHVAFCSLIASVQRCTGLWRLQEVTSMNLDGRLYLSYDLPCLVTYDNSVFDLLPSM